MTAPAVPAPPRLQLLHHPESNSTFWGYYSPDGAAAGVEPIDLHKLRAGARVHVGPGVATVLPDMDFETYSEAGCIWDAAAEKWRPPKGATKKSLPAVGVAAYATHPTTEILFLAYDLKDGLGRRQWLPGMPPPSDLFDHIARGGLIEAHNAAFEFWIWNHCATWRYGWPALPLGSLRDSMAKARAYSLPGALGNIGKVLNLDIQKDGEGKRLIQKFSGPRNPTKNNRSTRTRLEDDPHDAANYAAYNLTDIVTEAEASARMPDLPPEELAFWQATARMNYRGVGLDVESVNAAISILDQALETYNAELYQLTGGAVETASQIQRLQGWLGAWGVNLPSLDDATITKALGRQDLPEAARRALTIRQKVGSASVKKLYSMARQATTAGRLHELFNYHGARTGRDTAADVQPQNLPKAGPKLRWCEDATCGKPYGRHLNACPHCGAPDAFSREESWSWEAVGYALDVIKVGRLDWVEYVFGDALLTISGCIRGLFVAAPGYDLICSDFSAIEAVVTAMLAGEQWRIEAFERNDPIYLLSASQITGTPVEEYQAHKARTGEHHPDRQKIGKVAELGLGFGGWIGAWRNFDKSDNFTDDEVRNLIITWREVSPAIVELWGGQVRGKPWRPDYHELYGLEGAAIAAVQNPGAAYGYRGIIYQVKDDVLYCRLLSGRLITYHRPRLSPSTRWEGQVALSYEGWNSNPQMGPTGWVRIDTYGGRLTENVVQATARDIMRDAVLRLEAAGYPIVLRVHDELVAEVPEGTGDIDEFERIMSEPPTWAPGWPIRAAGGWRGKRYRKD